MPDLTCHPATPCNAITSITAEGAFDAEGLLEVSWSIQGDISRLVLPPVRSDTARVDGLWKTTCFEAFVRPGPPGIAYAEFNQSSSGDWAAYGFTGYREGMANLPGLPAAGFSIVRDDPEEATIKAIIDLSGFPRGAFSVGITAVIEETDGTKSYWALAHPPGNPDFHHADGFVLELAYG